ncbi:hypothetical protein [Sphingomonas sp. LB2R24]|uniref:hypothetical protein n=1 Tax=Sphingomonas sorbitolis TaxID=3096165 RepID=UPI002FCA6519
MQADRFTTTPAKAGAQLGTVDLAEAARRYLDLSTWAPASAGVAAGEVVRMRATNHGGREA